MKGKKMSAAPTISGMAIAPIPELVAELARAPATVEQLLALKSGDFIELDLKQAIQAKVAGVPVLDCHYGTSNGKYALKVDQLLAGSHEGWLGEHHVH